LTSDPATDFAASGPNRIRRLPQRGHYDRETIYRILDAVRVCHVGFVQDDQPFVIPTLCARDGDTLLLHGALASRLIAHIGNGQPVCISVAVLDGLVLAKSAFHHSVNYRSAVIFGRGSLVQDPAEKLRLLALLTERLATGRWATTRTPDARELNATAVAVVTIESASAKVRNSPPSDDERDLALPVWAGVLPIAEAAGTPIPASYSDPASPPPGPEMVAGA
jgi:nitroimidazol reductase NimA-like FMN-containing flavoprotein (pyridoxamine 5'-phosphate oxidase superfamily)